MTLRQLALFGTTSGRSDKESIYLISDNWVYKNLNKRSFSILFIVLVSAGITVSILC